MRAHPSDRGRSRPVPAFCRPRPAMVGLVRTAMPALTCVAALMLVVALAGCVSRVMQGATQPVAPQDDPTLPAVAPSDRVEVADVPRWLRLRLADYDGQTGPSAPKAVYEVPYRDGKAYLVVAGCCDELDPLYDVQGVLVCYPSGGYTGLGDGRCPFKMPAADRRREVWRHR